MHAIPPPHLLRILVLLLLLRLEFINYTPCLNTPPHSPIITLRIVLHQQVLTIRIPWIRQSEGIRRVHLIRPTIVQHASILPVDVVLVRRITRTRRPCDEGGRVASFDGLEGRSGAHIAGILSLGATLDVCMGPEVVGTEALAVLERLWDDGLLDDIVGEGAAADVVGAGGGHGDIYGWKFENGKLVLDDE